MLLLAVVTEQTADSEYVNDIHADHLQEQDADHQ